MITIRLHALPLDSQNSHLHLAALVPFGESQQTNLEQDYSLLFMMQKKTSFPSFLITVTLWFRSRSQII